MTRTPKSTRTRIAALNTRIICVLGFTYRHTKRQSVAISEIRKTKDTTSSIMGVLYPILTGGVKYKFPMLTLNLS